MRTRIPSGVLPLESEASTLVSHFLDHTNTSLPILSKTRLWLQVEALYTNVHDVLKQEDVCLVFRKSINTAKRRSESFCADRLE
jgi:hypothetical protein